jgi:hypothetical protein
MVNPKNGLKNESKHPVNINKKLNIVTCLFETLINNNDKSLVLPTLIKHGNTVNNIKKYNIYTTNTNGVFFK